MIATGEKSGYVSSYKIESKGNLKQVSRVESGKDNTVNDANWVSIVNF